jgi:hypothetical protein
MHVWCLWTKGFPTSRGDSRALRTLSVRIRSRCILLWHCRAAPLPAARSLLSAAILSTAGFAAALLLVGGLLPAPPLCGLLCCCAGPAGRAGPAVALPVHANEALTSRVGRAALQAYTGWR